MITELLLSSPPTPSQAAGGMSAPSCPVQPEALTLSRESSEPRPLMLEDWPGTNGEGPQDCAIEVVREGAVAEAQRYALEERLRLALWRAEDAERRLHAATAHQAQCSAERWKAQAQTDLRVRQATSHAEEADRRVAAQAKAAEAWRCKAEQNEDLSQELMHHLGTSTDEALRVKKVAEKAEKAQAASEQEAQLHRARCQELQATVDQLQKEVKGHKGQLKRHRDEASINEQLRKEMSKVREEKKQIDQAKKQLEDRLKKSQEEAKELRRSLKKAEQDNARLAAANEAFREREKALQEEALDADNTDAGTEQTLPKRRFWFFW